MKIAIFGGAGFIGRHLGNQCQLQDGEALGFDVVTPSCETLFPVDQHHILNDPIHLPPDIDVVYYLAQSTARDKGSVNFSNMFSINVTVALKAAEAAREYGAGCFCYASTGTVYQPGFEPFQEDRPVRRDQAYALSKVMAEEALTLLDNSIHLLCVRLFGVFGPTQTEMLVPNITDRIREGQPVTLNGNPNDPDDRNGLRISLTFVEDVVDCLSALTRAKLERRKVPNILNVASDQAISIRRLAEAIGREIGVEPRFESVPENRESDYIADVTRLRALIDTPFATLEEAISRTLAPRV